MPTDNESDLFYPLPKSWLDLNRSGDDNATLTRDRSGPSNIHLVSSDDLLKIAIVQKRQAFLFRDAATSFDYSWAQFGIDLVGGIVGGIGGLVLTAAINALKPPQVIGLPTLALQQIGSIVRQQIDAAFQQHYSGEVEGVRQKLLTYGETNDIGKLNEAEAQCDNLVPHLYGFGYPALGGYFMATNLHLTALIGKAAINPSYKATCLRKKAEYAGNGILLANQAVARLQTRVNTCSCSGGHGHIRGEGSQWGYSCNCAGDWGADKRSFSDGGEGAMPAGKPAELSNACNATRDQLLQGTVVNPIQMGINPIVLALNQLASA
ncbi:Uncharacterized protein OS=Bacillus weihenstephanensis (strain KBAB4) GN=BcerKBAB4_5631 PE=4 SV=1 [Gemmata massiliana]|uniref:Uncharacterized protein n=1 Tax=Gemmata massiliana TaxID=1210884 RepID=A0A6P2DBS1_9BACT|nr:hypothetical protein [Gemmata massiliana]VTR99198.1 Uncharacterized protein OS=Bacillus weihenstephanensis (strain KBAB4) GN=BcerKBAB4_5631 PE=4 SV=1 [Gemmata massiliana]